MASAFRSTRRQPLFGFWGRHTRQRADLRVRELTAGERLRQPRQRSARARNSDPLAGRAGIEPDAPGQPRSARVEPVAAAAACVELTDEVEKPPGGGIEVAGQLGDLVAETIHLSGAASGGFDHGIDADAKIAVHGRLLRWSAPTLHHDFRGLPALPGRAIARRSPMFSADACPRALRRRKARWWGIRKVPGMREHPQLSTLSREISRDCPEWIGFDTGRRQLR